MFADSWTGAGVSVGNVLAGTSTGASGAGISAGTTGAGASAFASGWATSTEGDFKIDAGAGLITGAGASAGAGAGIGALRGVASGAGCEEPLLSAMLLPHSEQTQAWVKSSNAMVAPQRGHTFSAIRTSLDGRGAHAVPLRVLCVV